MSMPSRRLFRLATVHSSRSLKRRPELVPGTDLMPSVLTNYGPAPPQNITPTRATAAGTSSATCTFEYGSAPIAMSRRYFARSSDPCDETPKDKAKTFVISIGYDSKLAQGVVDALSEGGLSGEALLATVRSMAGRWEVGEDEGMEALVASVKQNLARTEGKSMVKIWCIPPNAWSSGEGEEANIASETDEDRQVMMSRAFPVEALDGTSITDVAKFGEGEGASTLGEYIECACSGIMACSTCHVVIDPAWIDKVGNPGEDEQDMLDLAYSPRETSRLGCQVVITNDLEGMVIRLPKGANNLMDYVPFE
mmetsp:Transcript_20101/g.43336  ORF Transcript_20101/g.43336 Transcript_20101/m.43336 type:complete len:309 (-) Transcript_20101:36-962(-)